MTHLPAAAHGVLQPGRRDGWRRARHGDARGGVDNGNGVTAAGGRWLVDLHARMLRLVAGRDEGGRGRVEGEAGGNGLRLLRGRGFRRVAGERGALRRTGNGDQVALGQQARTELEVILQVKRPAGLEPVAKSVDGSDLGKVLHSAAAAHLPLGVLGDRETGCPAVAAAGVVVAHRGRLRRVRIVVVV
jgi:hypothetical protein